MKQVYIFLFVSMFSLYAWSVNLPNPVVDAIYSDQFKTVQFHPVGKSLEPPVVFLNNMQQADFISRHKRNLDGMLQCIFSHRGEIPWHHNDLAVDFHNINVYS